MDADERRTKAFDSALIGGGDPRSIASVPGPATINELVDAVAMANRRYALRLKELRDFVEKAWDSGEIRDESLEMIDQHLAAVRKPN